MVILLNGTHGVGKSAVAGLVAERFPDAVVLKADWRSSAFESEALKEIESARVAGAVVFVCEVLYLDPERLRSFAASTDDFCFSIYLNASEATLKERLHGRSESEVSESLRVRDEQSRHLAGGYLGKVVETDGRDLDLVALKVVHEVDKLLSC